MKRPAIALPNSPTVLSGSPQGYASPRPAAAPLTAPAQHGDESLYEADDRLTMSTINPVRLTLGRTNLGGRSPATTRLGRR